MTDDRAFLKEFFQAMAEHPLDPDDARDRELYVPLHDATTNTAYVDDPVVELMTAIEFSDKGPCVQLLSGYRGTGKTTELKRLAKELRKKAYKVVHVDMDAYLNMSMPVDITDFILGLACAFGDELVEKDMLATDPKAGKLWTRVTDFFKEFKITISSDFDLETVGLKGVKAYLKAEPSVRSQIQQRVSQHLDTLVLKVKDYFRGCVDALRSRWGDVEVVFLVDSVEHIRGTYKNSAEVQASLNTLFGVHGEHLMLGSMYVVYTVPPYLRILSPNIGRDYGIRTVNMYPAIKVRDEGGSVHDPGLQRLREIVANRGQWTRLLQSQEQLDRIILMSGGNLRDLLRILQKVILIARALPVPDATVNHAINQIRSDFLPIAHNEAEWLARIATTHQIELDQKQDLPILAGFFDSHLVLCYQNGTSWYNVHPIIRDEILKQAADYKQRKSLSGKP